MRAGNVEVMIYAGTGREAEAFDKALLAATPHFKSGSSSPREFLERCLVDLTALEPKIGAFVDLNIEAARNAADASSARRRGGFFALLIHGMPIHIKDIPQIVVSRSVRL